MKPVSLKTIILIFSFSCLLPYQSIGQYWRDFRPISTRANFLIKPSNARIGGFAEITAVSSNFYPETGLYLNPALLSRNSKYVGGNLSYSPWDGSVGENEFSAEFSGFYSINTSNAIGYSFSAHRLGDILLTDETGTSLGMYNWFEQCHQFTYNHSFKNGISIGTGMKYIRSNPGFESLQGVYINPANSIAFDFGFAYTKTFKLNDAFGLGMNVGTAINHFGSKIKYTDSSEDDGEFLPQIWSGGVLLSPEWKVKEDLLLSLDLAYQFEKLLVPTPPIYKTDSNGMPIPIPGTDKYEIEKGMDPDVSVFKGAIQSFYDAPNGFKEELQEIKHKLATELRLVYQRKFFVAGRFGMVRQNENKGYDNYNTWGIGIGFYGFSIDFKHMGADDRIYNETYALTIGFRTTLSKPALRF